MNTTQLEALIGALTVLGMLALVVLPSVIGVVRDRRIDRQLREAAAREAAIEGAGPERRTRKSASHRMARAA